MPLGLVEHRHDQIAAPRNASLRAIRKLWSPLSAAVAAACAIEQGLEVDCDCSFDIALISHAGPPAKPIRQPVME